MSGKPVTSLTATVHDLRLAAASHGEIVSMSRLNEASDRHTLACKAVRNGVLYYQNQVAEVMRDLAVAEHQPRQPRRRQTDPTPTASDRVPLSKFLR